MDCPFQRQQVQGSQCQVASCGTVKEEEGFATPTRPSEFGNTRSAGSSTSQSKTQGRKEKEEESLGQTMKKKVRFDDAVYIHLMCTWSYASRKARERYWEYFVWDRQHFQERIRRFQELFIKCIKGPK